MSEFDKEAEREKLREKYERDEQDRESTRQMSELLLQGATMTNRHCDDCGNPIFRYDGQEFCANCQQVEGEDAAAQDGQQDPQPDQGDQQQTAEQRGAAADENQGQQAETQNTQRTTDPDQGTGPETSTPGAATADQHTDRPDAAVDRRETERERRSATGQDAGRIHDQERSTREQVGRDRSRHTPSRDGEAALWSALEKFARQAEATDDPREAQACLAAAREAAEALSALRR